MSKTALIPDRRRTHFAPHGGPRPTHSDREQGRRGLAKARKALEAVEPCLPSAPTVVHRLTPEQINRARRGIAAAREALR